MVDAVAEANGDEAGAEWQRRVVGRSLRTAAERSVDRGLSLIQAAATALERSNGDDITVQDVADEAGQSLRTLYQYFESKDDLLLAVFEEAMRTYALLIRRAIAELDDPLERLAGALLAAVRMPEHSGSGLDRGLARLRLKLSEVGPDRFTQAQTAVATLLRETVEAAMASGQVVVRDAEAATFVLLSLNGAYITSETLGNDAGVRRPDAVELTLFCLRGFGADVDEAWLGAVEGRLHFPSRRGWPRPAGATAPARKAPARKAPARKAAVKKAAVKKAPAKSVAKKAPAKKARAARS
jgi:AcrR family transcriptional regulator